MLIADTIRFLIAQTGETPLAINSGNCDWFAHELSFLYPQSKEHNTFGSPELPAHFWVEIEGRHYDAEAPEGVDDWRALPIFQRTQAEVGRLVLAKLKRDSKKFDIFSKLGQNRTHEKHSQNVDQS